MIENGHFAELEHIVRLTERDVSVEYVGSLIDIQGCSGAR